MAQQITVTIRRKEAQTTGHVLMIEPVAFAFNRQTSGSNYFQRETVSAQPKALKEFRTMVAKLRSNGVNVLVINDSLLPHTPDSIFPHHAVSFHAGGRAYLYPMCAANRRQEADRQLLNAVKKAGFVLKEIYDMRQLADGRHFLEGMGSMVLDRGNGIAYACRSERTNETWFRQMCKRFKYEAVVFNAYHTVGWKRLPIYHTSVMMTVAETFVVICLDAVSDDKQRQLLLDKFDKTNKTVIGISEKQLHQFAGNMRQVRTDKGEKRLVMSSGAYHSLTDQQIERIEAHCPIIHTDIATIEENGGSSVGCMMAEIFLPRRGRA
ncbi:MAG: amidinotransferase [Gammaproteobacteria bacterium]|nr:MAG: amidinotransferase [Gammaproteobacteria bacterium]